MNNEPEWLRNWRSNPNPIQRAPSALELAARDGRKTYFTGDPCPRGHVAERSVSNGMCIECRRLRERLINLSPEQVERKREHNRTKQITWRKAHTAEWNAIVAHRRSCKLQAMPEWADRAAIAAFYAEAERLTRETGEPHHVDHIVPLRSKLVCGLHVPANLQVLPGAENARKSNRYWPDMP